MPKKEKSIPYECPRCGYQTHRLPLMRGHLYKKRPCPANKCTIVLTDEIRQKVLDDRFYFVPSVVQTHVKNDDDKSIQQQQQTSNNIYIQQNNQYYINNFNNFMEAIPMETKIPAFLKCTNMNIESIDQMVHRSLKEIGWLGNIDKDQEYRNPTPVVKINDYPKWIDHMTKMHDMSDDSKSKNKHKKKLLPGVFSNDETIGFYDGLKYSSLDEKDIMMLILKRAQEHFFNSYESHLKERATFDSDSNPVVMRAKNLLKDYYKVLQAFGLYTTLEPPDEEQWKRAQNDSDDGKKQLINDFISIIKGNSDRNTEYIMGQIKNYVMPGDFPLGGLPPYPLLRTQNN